MNENLLNLLDKAAGRAGKTALRSAGDKAGVSNVGGNRPARPASSAKKPALFTRMAALYEAMEAAYKASAEAAALRCDKCPTNCCTSFFQHHTYVEWAYLWRGLSLLPAARRKELIRRAGRYLDEARQAMAMSVTPTAMCPLNEEGLCVLYPYRLMICRMHGTRNVFTRPDGTRQEFPGCARFTAMHGEAGQEGPEPLDRTPLYHELAALEQEFRQRAARPLPGVSLTLAEMVVSGPPKLR